MKKNLFSMLVISVLALAIVGCAKSTDENNAGGSTVEAQVEVKFLEQRHQMSQKP